MELNHPTIAKMREQTARWERRRDNRAIFLRCYTMMTANMLRAVEAGRFEDNPWVARLVDRFADYYFNALACFDCGDPVPRVWQQVHTRAAERELHVLQHLLLGINAHINYDLVLTLYELLAPEWEQLTEVERTSRYRDHCRVNTIIGETIDRVQDEVVEKYSPLMRLVDSALGRLDERLLLGLIARWREMVWENTQILLGCSGAEQRKQCLEQLESSVIGNAQWVQLQLFSSAD